MLRYTCGPSNATAQRPVYVVHVYYPYVSTAFIVYTVYAVVGAVERPVTTPKLFSPCVCSAHQFWLPVRRSTRGKTLTFINTFFSFYEYVTRRVRPCTNACTDHYAILRRTAHIVIHAFYVFCYKVYSVIRSKTRSCRRGATGATVGQFSPPTTFQGVFDLLLIILISR